MEAALANSAKGAQKAKTRQGKAGQSRGARKATAAGPASDLVSLQKLAENFSKRRIKDQKKLTPLQRRMMSGGA
jgi:hypothetical protein